MAGLKAAVHGVRWAGLVRGGMDVAACGVVMTGEVPVEAAPWSPSITSFLFYLVF